MRLNKPLEKFNKNKEANWPWSDFPDCPVCRAMKEGRGNTLQELKKAFKEARTTNK